MIRSLVVLSPLLLATCTETADDPDPPACGVITPGDEWTGRASASLAIVATNPSPPARFTNWWAVRVDDREGAPMIDPARLTVTAVMPEDGLGAPRIPEVTAEPDGLVVGPLELWTPGRWEIRFDLDGDRIVVPVCIDE